MQIVFQGVHKRLVHGGQELTILDEVDLTVGSGEFVALMGPSGSGKSTLLNLAAGLDRPSRGSVRVGDFEPGRMSENELCDWRSRHLGFIFQRYHLLATLTAAQNVEVPLLLRNLPHRERRRRVETALELVGLSERARHFPSQLSGGQEQRVAIARAIVADPSVLLADEPTGDLDARSANEILDLMCLLQQHLRKTILMVTHDAHAAQRATRVVFLEKGTLRVQQ